MGIDNDISLVKFSCTESFQMFRWKYSWLKKYAVSIFLHLTWSIDLADEFQKVSLFHHCEKLPEFLLMILVKNFSGYD